ncbi:hypothetical protein ATO67_19370 [Agrobacterium bohemicum]|uniref:Uncharacterized protein n=1 Tax=Agrobacterium bohemicum TaxID=2052828 RepID=A0A135P7U1_9HYPH|nr:hypothetical protein ATO67_19370 [Agrobacterium bohemicum]
MDADSTFPLVAIAGQIDRRLNIEIGGKPEENGVIDAIVANGENAATFMTDANGVGEMNIVTIDGNR